MNPIPKFFLAFALVGCAIGATILVVPENSAEDESALVSDAVDSASNSQRYTQSVESESTQLVARTSLKPVARSVENADGTALGDAEKLPITPSQPLKSVATNFSAVQINTANSQNFAQAAADKIALELWTAVKARFPELGLGEATPTVRVATSRDTLQSAITVAQSESGDDMIVLRNTTSQVWKGTEIVSINGTAANGAITIVGINADRTFTNPVVLKGFGISIADTNTAQVNLANFSIKDFANTALNIGGSGSVKASCVSVYNCGNPSGVGAIATSSGASAVITLYNITVSNCKALAGGAAVNATYGTMTAYNCTFINNTRSAGNPSGDVPLNGGTYNNCLFSGAAIDKDSATKNNCIFVATGIAGISSETGATVLHHALQSSSNAIDPSPETTGNNGMTYDALSNSRVSGGKLDAGAVESQTGKVLEPPVDFTVVSSGTRQVYLGWTHVPDSLNVKIQWRSPGISNSWEDVPTAQVKFSQNKLDNNAFWHSARVVDMAPGTTKYFRLAFQQEENGAWITTDGTHSAATLATSTIPQLTSKPGAKKTIYLNFAQYVFDDVFTGEDFEKSRMSDYRMASYNIETTPQYPFKEAKYAVIPNYENTSWGYYDSDKNAITNDEAIRRIYRQVAEDWAMFDVNVTTIEPNYADLEKTDSTDENFGARVLIGCVTAENILTQEVEKISWLGATGIAAQNKFGTVTNSVCVCIGNNASCAQTAMTITHELGHALGVVHDSGYTYWDKIFYPLQEYYQGVSVTFDEKLSESNESTNSSNTIWFPIMGGSTNPERITSVKIVDYYDYQNQWSKGGYSLAKDGLMVNGNTEHQDDIAVILSNGINLQADDAGDDFANARVFNSSDWTNSSTLSYHGIIGKNVKNDTLESDVDVFKFAVNAAGRVRIDVFTDTRIYSNGVLQIPDGTGDYWGVSLDAKVEIYNSDGSSIGSANLPLESRFIKDVTKGSTFRDAQLASVSLPAAGIYYVKVSGIGRKVASTTIKPAGFTGSEFIFNDPTDYGSVGQYSLNLTLSETSAVDVETTDPVAKFNTWTNGKTSLESGEKTLDAPPANDGKTNLEKFVFDTDGKLDPTKPAGAFGSTSIVTENEGIPTETDYYFQVDFPYNANADDVALSAEYVDTSATTPAWTSDVNKVFVTKAAGKITVKLSTPVSASAPKGAVRLKGTLGGKTFTTEAYGYERIVIPAGKGTTKYALRVHKPFIFQREIPAGAAHPFTTTEIENEVAIIDADLAGTLDSTKSYIVEIITESAGTFVSSPFIINRSFWRNITTFTKTGNLVKFTSKLMTNFINGLNGKPILGYRVREATTFADIFGTDLTKSGLFSGTTRVADTVSVHILDQNLWSFSVNGTYSWYSGTIKGAGVDPSKTPVFYHRPISIIRRSEQAPDIEYILSGEVLSESQQVHVYRSDVNIASGLLFGESEVIAKPTAEEEVRIDSNLSTLDNN